MAKRNLLKTTHRGKGASAVDTMDTDKSTEFNHAFDALSGLTRLSPQLSQELDSKSSLIRWLNEQQWLCNSPVPDLGIDVLVEIFDKGRPTGMFFSVQHKSIDDIEKAKLKTSTSISYPLELKDIAYWRTLLIPFFVIICDAKKTDERYWIHIEDIVKQLENHGTQVLKQEKVNIRIPLTNILTKASLSCIRCIIANHYLPSVSKKHGGVDIGLSFSFPDTTEGRKERESFDKFIDTGSSVTISKKHILTLKTPPWHQRLYGDHIPDKLTFSTATSKAKVHFRLEAQTPDGRLVPSQQLELRVLSSGRKEITLTNDQQQNPLVFTFVCKDEEGHQVITSSFIMKHAGKTVYEMRDTLAFVLATADNANIQLIETSSGKCLNAGTVSLSDNFLIGRLRMQYLLAEQLCFIQVKFGFPKVLSPNGHHITQKDYVQVNRLASICRTGKWTSLGTISGIVLLEPAMGSELYKTWLTTNTIPGPMEAELSNNETAEIIEYKIDLGKTKTYVKYTQEQTNDFFNQIRQATERGASEAKIHIDNVILETTALEWNPHQPSCGFRMITAKRKETYKTPPSHRVAVGQKQ